MKKKDIPQDKSALSNHTKELCYAQGENGEYETALSSGWEPKTVALSQALGEINTRKIEALQGIIDGNVSPIAYYMEERLMDMNILSSYSGFFKFTIKKHISAKSYQKLPDKKLEKYATAFDISLEELKSFNAQEVLNDIKKKEQNDN